jgi:hypothetical protein
MNITLDTIEKRIMGIKEKISNETKINERLKEFVMLNTRYESICNENRKLYNKLFSEEKEKTTQITPTTTTTTTASTHLNTEGLKASFTEGLKASFTEGLKEKEVVAQDTLIKSNIKMNNYLESQRIPDRPPIKIIPLPLNDETDDLDTEEDDVGSPKENWVDLGSYKFKCYIDDKLIKTRVNYNIWTNNGERNRLPKDTILGYVTYINDKKCNHLYVNGLKLPIYHIDEQAWEYVGDMNENNSILSKWYFEPNVEFIKESEFKKAVNKGKTGLYLFTSGMVYYPLENHKLNFNKSIEIKI